MIHKLWITLRIALYALTLYELTLYGLSFYELTLYGLTLYRLKLNDSFYDDYVNHHIVTIYKKKLNIKISSNLNWQFWHLIRSKRTKLMMNDRSDKLNFYKFI